MNEQDIERLAKRLGKRGDRVDPERMADSVMSALRQPIDRKPWWRQVRVLQAAAAVVILAVSSTVIIRNSGQEDSLVAAPADVELLSSDELGEVLDSLSWDMPASEAVSLGFYDLQEDELLELLEELEG